MPVDVGTGIGQYAPTIDHVTNGEKGNETVYRRPSIDLENRTEALKSFAESEETRLDGVSSKADQNESDIGSIQTQADTNTTNVANHVGDTTQHTDFALVAEALAGSSEVKVISPYLLKSVLDIVLGHVYNAVVGDTALAGVTHASLAAALAASSDGWKILVLDTEYLDSPVIVDNDNIEIEFKRGVSLVQATATTGMIVTGNDLYLSKARFEGFATTAIEITATANRTVLRDTRYNTNTANVTDDGTATNESGQIYE